jgi:hypothetical protein
MFALFRSRRPDPLAAVTDESLRDTLAAAQHLATLEADAALTPTRAEAQRSAILARLAATDDPRVLSFPPRADGGAPRGRFHARPAFGWGLTAAAAGLVIGVGTGHGLAGLMPAASAPVTPRLAAHAPRPTPPPPDLDDEILGDVEAAAGRGVDELQPLDRLTPTVVTLIAAR